MDRFKAAFDEARRTKDYRMNWSVWEHEKVHCGDRFLMLRVGAGRTGIVMSGRVISEPYHDEDWSGKGRMTYYVNLLPDLFIDTDCGPRLSVADLERAFPKYVWKEGHSGMVLSDSLGTKLEWLWLDFLRANYVDAQKKNLTCNVYDTDKYSILNFYHYNMVEPLQLDLVKHRGAACEICGYDYDKVFDASKIGRNQNIYYMFPAMRSTTPTKKMFHCVCANCRNIYRDLCNDSNDGELLPFESLEKVKR